MLEKLSIAFLGLAIGGTAFLVTGLAVFLTISRVEDRSLQAQAPRQPTAAQYAQLNFAR